MAWKQGPPPADAKGFGCVVPRNPGNFPLMEAGGFYYADFKDGHAICMTSPHPTLLEGNDIEWYDNSIELPPVNPPLVRKGWATGG